MTSIGAETKEYAELINAAMMAAARGEAQECMELMQILGDKMRSDTLAKYKREVKKRA